jgi:hypothetical protein
MGWNAKMICRVALPAQSYCPRHKRLLVGWNGERDIGPTNASAPISRAGDGSVRFGCY